MSWIEIVEPEDAEGRLEKIYKSVQTPDGHVDHFLKIHSLRPMTLKGHLEIYKAALHSKPNGLSMRESSDSKPYFRLSTPSCNIKKNIF